MTELSDQNRTLDLEALKPCPFCETDTHLIFPETQTSEGYAKGWIMQRVVCTHPAHLSNIEGPAAVVSAQTIDPRKAEPETIAAWNRRDAARQEGAPAGEVVGWRLRRKGSAIWSLCLAEPLFDRKIWDREDYDVEPLYAQPPRQEGSPPGIGGEVISKAYEFVKLVGRLEHSGDGDFTSRDDGSFDALDGLIGMAREIMSIPHSQAEGGGA